MTLLELLVKELHKYGGWPEAMACACQSRADSEIYFYKKLYHYSHVTKGLCDFSIYLDGCCKSESNHDGYIYVTRTQYEAALAASQKPVWNGEGVPPVGCACEMQDSKGTWLPVDIIAKNDGFTFGWSYDYRIVFFGDKADEFRPIRTEADKKRDEVINNLAFYVGVKDCEDLYDAIAEGNIPGVKLDD